MIGRLGNHMWQYAVCRTLAEQNNYEFHIPRSFLGAEIFSCSLGVEQELVNQEYYDYFKNKSFMAQFYNPEILHLQDFTRLVGYFQSERYIIDNKKNIQEWFKLRQENVRLINELNLANEVCVIHFRGGDYKKILDVYLRLEYWQYSIAEMKKLHGEIEFIVVTDDVEAAHTIFPDFSIYSSTVSDDFYIISQAKYLILSNSTFSWWGAWLNQKCKTVIAPKYWMQHNQSEGWWAPGESITKGFNYICRNGRLFSSKECIDEFNSLGFGYSDFPY